MSIHRSILVAAVVALGVAACSSDDTSSDETTADDAVVEDSVETATEGGGESTGDESPDEDSAESDQRADADDGEQSAEEAALDDAEELADEIAEDLQETQEAVGGGGATLVVGDQIWEFTSVLCAFGEEEIGQEGAEFVLSSVENGLQLYASVDSFGHVVSIDDIQDFENPSVSLSTIGDGFVVIDGKSISAEAEFLDSTSTRVSGTPGTLAATCP